MLNFGTDSFDDKPNQKEPSNGNSETSENKESLGGHKSQVKNLGSIC